MTINPELLRFSNDQLETAVTALYAALKTAKKIEQRAFDAHARRPLPSNKHDLEDARINRRQIEDVILTFENALVQKARENA